MKNPKIFLWLCLTVILCDFPVISSRAAVFTPNRERSFADGKNKIVWVANAIHKTALTQQYEKIILLNYLNEAYKHDPQIPYATMLKQLNAAQAEFNQKRKQASTNEYLVETPKEIFNSMLNIVSLLPYGGEASVVARELYYWTDKHVSNQFGPYSQIKAQMDVLGDASLAQLYQNAQLEAAYDLANTNMEAATAINTFFSGQWNAFTGDTSEDIFNKNIEFANTESIRYIRQNMLTSDDLSITENNLKEHLKNNLDDIDKRIDRSRQLIEQVLQNQQTEKSKERTAQLEKDFQKLQMDAAASGIYILSSLANLIGNPKLGKVIGVVGNSTITIFDSVRKYGETLNKFKESGSALGSLVLTGNILGAAINLVGLFAGGGPSPEQVIIDQLNEVKKQIGALSNSMDAHFEQVDKNLNVIYNVLNTGLNHVIGKLDIIDENVVDVQRSLFRLEDNLVRLESRLTELMQTSAQIEFQNHLNAIISYKADHIEPMPYNLFVDYANELYTWATVHSKDAIMAGALTRNFEDDDLYKELSAPLDENLNFLSSYVKKQLSNKGITEPYTGERLANPVLWQIVAGAYIRLMSEWPSHFEKMSQNWTSANGKGLFGVYGSGREIDNFVRRTTMIRSGTENRPNHQLFNSLIDNHQKKTKEFLEALKDAEKEYLMQFSKSPQIQAANLDLNFWGTPSQNTVRISRPFVTIGIGADQKKYPLELNDEFLVDIPNQYLIADHIGLGVFISKFNASWQLKTSKLGRGEQVTGTHNLEIEMTISFRMKSGLEFELSRRKYLNDRNVYFEIGIGGSPQAPTDAIKHAGTTHWWEGENGIQKKFMTKSQLIFKKSDTNEIDNILKTEFFDNQQNLSYFLLQKTRPLYASARKLTAAKMLLENYLCLGMYRPMLANDTLRATMYGSQGLMDHEKFERQFASYIMRTRKEMEIKLDPEAHPRIRLYQENENSSKLLTVLVKEILDKQLYHPYKNIPETLAKLEVLIQMIDK